MVITLIPVNQAQTTDLWGVSKGDSKTYDLTMSIQGIVNDENLVTQVTYQILEKKDYNDNGYDDLLVYIKYSEVEMEYFLRYWPFMWFGESVYPVLFPLNTPRVFVDNETFEWTQGNYVNYTPYYLLAIPLFTEIQLIMPIAFNLTNHGFNWSAACETLNTEPNMSCSFKGNSLVINQSVAGTDPYLGEGMMEFNIEWDIMTGWLTFFELNFIFPEENLVESMIFEETTIEDGIPGFTIVQVFGIVALIGVVTVFLKYNKQLSKVF
ncbi:MAG TPA: hypothetical protein VMV49_15380 [Candidatus Deferrimicrobium sp.]|nr:hypothetical protein [Candidatus Deferrimicrobium sp.]